ncbi:MAG: hypothetical protein JW953_10120 [Anaerolineae bacterium]|nr:hypothetical protein [Anaerolineae bacterium]
MYTPIKSTLVIFLLIVLFVGACSAPAPPSISQPPPAATSAPPTVAAVLDDPFAYCAAVGSIDAPDARYNGPKLPASVAQNAIEQGIVPPDMPPDIQMAMEWRCMNGQVWVCHVGANLPCGEKADLSKTPTSAMEDFCQANPTADNIPAVVTGRATVYEWKCNTGKAEIIRQIFQADPQGYLADFWYQLAPPPIIARNQPLRFDVGPMTVQVTGTVVSGQRDYYPLSLMQGELLQVQLTALESNAAFSLKTSEGTPWPGTEEGTDTTSGFWIVPADGEYLIDVGPTRGNASYTLNAQTQDPAYAPAPDCAAIGAAAEKALGVKFAQSSKAFNDGGKSGGVGCALTASATGAQWAEAQTPLDQLRPTLNGWADEGMLAGGATGVVYSFSKDDQWLMVSSSWQPSPDANCPPDQPISACDVKPEQKLYTLELIAAQGVWSQMAYKPVSRPVCNQLNQDLITAASVGFVQSFAAPFTDFISGESGLGCALEASGTGLEFKSAPEVMNQLRGALAGWTENPTYQADGPTGTAMAFTRDKALLLVNVDWQPSPDANCPQDQPISACPLKPEQQLYMIKVQAAHK